MQKGAGFFAFLIFLCLLNLTGPAAIPASAGGQDAAAQKPLRYEVNVVFKLVQVYAVDRKGNPVTDLTAADFELTDDGKKQKIEHFEKVQIGSLRRSPQPEADAAPMPSSDRHSAEILPLLQLRVHRAGRNPEGSESRPRFPGQPRPAYGRDRSHHLLQDQRPDDQRIPDDGPPADPRRARDRRIGSRRRPGRPSRPTPEPERQPVRGRQHPGHGPGSLPQR